MRRTYTDEDWKYEFRKYLEERGITPVSNRPPSLLALLCIAVFRLIKDVEELRR